MREGILLSAGLHAGIVAVAIAGLPQLLEANPPLDIPIVVDVITVDESEIEKPRPKLEPVEPAHEPAAQPEAPPPPPPAARPLPPPAQRSQLAALPPEPAPEPVPVSTPEREIVRAALEAPPPKPVSAAPPKTLTPKAKPETIVEPKPEKPKKLARRVEPPRRKPPPPPDEFKMLLRNLHQQRQQHAALQNKVPEVRAKKPRLKRPERRQVSKIERQRVVSALVQSIQTQVRACWNPPIGAKDAHEIRVRVRILLNPDGTLIRRPYIVDRDRLFRDPAFQAFAESAIRALQNPRCSPLRLPLANYDIWREISFNFDTTELLQ